MIKKAGRVTVELGKEPCVENFTFEYSNGMGGAYVEGLDWAIKKLKKAKKKLLKQLIVYKFIDI